MAREDVFNPVGYRLAVGPSQIVGVTVIAGQNSVAIKYFSGGSLEIGGSTLSWGIGYVMGINEIINMQSSGTFYLAATGSTAVCMILKGRTDGF